MKEGWKNDLKHFNHLTFDLMVYIDTLWQLDEFFSKRNALQSNYIKKLKLITKIIIMKTCYYYVGESE